MLSRHEKESKLHADNLAKAAAASAMSAAGQLPQGPAQQYRDRAEERRELFGSVADHVRSRSPLGTSDARDASARPAAPAAPAAAVPVSADASNPGNQLLRRMGWKEGQGLGKAADGKVEAVGVEHGLPGSNGSGSVSGSSTMRGALKATAAAAGAAGGGAESLYRDNLAAATRARYDQIDRR
jgi:hypothetical protein